MTRAFNEATDWENYISLSLSFSLCVCVCVWMYNGLHARTTWAYAQPWCIEHSQLPVYLFCCLFLFYFILSNLTRTHVRLIHSLTQSYNLHVVDLSRARYRFIDCESHAAFGRNVKLRGPKKNHDSKKQQQ